MTRTIRVWFQRRSSALIGTAWIALVLGVAASGCQQPLRCGALDELCCGDGSCAPSLSCQFGLCKSADGAPCTLDEECGIYHYCNTFVSECRRRCLTSEACAPTEFCVSDGLQGGCFGDDGCSPFGGVGCTSGASCYPYGSTAFCWQPGSKIPGEPCDGHIECTPGHGCITIDDIPRCQPLCDSAHPCSVGTCAPLENETRYGVCFRGGGGG